jgi:hypothetical protein
MTMMIFRRDEDYDFPLRTIYRLRAGVKSSLRKVEAGNDAYGILKDPSS